MPTAKKDKPMGVISLLSRTNRLVWMAVSGKHTSPAVTIGLRLTLGCLVLSCAGRTLWHGLLAMPSGVGVFIGSVVVLRIGLWFWRRHH